MKQDADKFTIDAFQAPRRGRPRLATAKSNAQRQREFRARKDRSLTPVQLAKQQVRMLGGFSSRLAAMSADWSDVDEYFRGQLDNLASSVSELQSALSEYIDCDGEVN